MTKRSVIITYADSFEELTPEELGRLVAQSKELGKLFEGAEKFAHAQLTEGRAVTGWELKPGNVSRVWKSDELAKSLMAEQGINDPYEPQKLLSVAQAEKKVAKPALLKPGWDSVPGNKVLRPASVLAQSQPDFGF